MLLELRSRLQSKDAARTEVHSENAARSEVQSKNAARTEAQSEGVARDGYVSSDNDSSSGRKKKAK